MTKAYDDLRAQELRNLRNNGIVLKKQKRQTLRKLDSTVTNDATITFDQAIKLVGEVVKSVNCTAYSVILRFVGGKSLVVVGKRDREPLGVEYSGKDVRRGEEG